MGEADATVDGEGHCQIFIKAVEPRTIHFVHQLSSTDDLCGRQYLKSQREKKREREKKNKRKNGQGAENKQQMAHFRRVVG